MITRKAELGEALTPDQLAAHHLLSELRTRIAVQHLPYQHGVEARALESLSEIFGLARQAMKDHPGCSGFAQRATQMLNVEVRPVTAKWHRAHVAGLLDSRDGANEFRAELRALNVKLRAFSLELQDMAYGVHEEDAETPLAITQEEVDSLFEPVEFGISSSSNSAADQINAYERAEIKTRREETLKRDQTEGIVRDPKSPEDTHDAVGLALSGGGIRSATFCMGVVQVLAEKKLLGQFDYLSTVSGGGYTGSFISSSLGGNGDLAQFANPHGPDTISFRHVRQHAKYLSATDLKARWSMLVRTVAGMLLNWSAPLFVLATAACLATLSRDGFTAVLTVVTGLLGIGAAAALPLYGLSVRFGNQERRVFAVLAGLTGLTVFAAGILAIEMAYTPLSNSVTHISATSIAVIAAVLPAVARFMPMFRSVQAKKIFFKVIMLAAGIAVPVLALSCFYLLRHVAVWARDPEASAMLPIHYVDGSTIVWTIAATSGLFAFLGLNINATSPHKIYRDALARTFLRPEEGADNEKLSAVNPTGLAPYHLINATVNLPSSTNPVLRDRRGDFFLFSKFWTGSMATGYRRTSHWNIGGGEVDLATAMAVSGASASPHMGLESMPTLTALLAFLNIRLGLWVPNPDQKHLKTPGFACLVREMTGAWMSETSHWLNLTDGGHIENLGVYELLRRRCKFIVSIDGEADPKLTFHGNLTLVRHAQIDMGIRIEPRLDDLRLNARGFSRTHAQLFKIIYPAEGVERPAAIGFMLYLKLSLTGNEAELLKRYRILNPDFPHQSTADQFYDEEQFEAYRQLGVHVGEGVFSRALLTAEPEPKTVSAWFRQLAQNMLEPTAI